MRKRKYRFAEDNGGRSCNRGTCVCPISNDDCIHFKTCSAEMVRQSTSKKRCQCAILNCTCNSERFCFTTNTFTPSSNASIKVNESCSSNSRSQRRKMNTKTEVFSYRLFACVFFVASMIQQTPIVVVVAERPWSLKLLPKHHRHKQPHEYQLLTRGQQQQQPQPQNLPRVSMTSSINSLTDVKSMTNADVVSRSSATDTSLQNSKNEEKNAVSKADKDKDKEEEVGGGITGGGTNSSDDHQSTKVEGQRSPDEEKLTVLSNRGDATSLTTHQTRQPMSSSIISSCSTFLLGVVKEMLSPERIKKLMVFTTSLWLMKKIIEELSNAIEDVIQETNESLREDHDQYMFSRSVIDDISSTSIPFYSYVAGFNRASNVADSNKYNKGHDSREGNRDEKKKDSNKKRRNNNNKKNNHLKKKRSIVDKQSRRPLSAKHHLAREMLYKLHLAGLPLEAQVQQKIEEQQQQQEEREHNDSDKKKDNDDDDMDSDRTKNDDNQTTTILRRIKTAESVLRSLTKSEGHLLNSCLWVPPASSPAAISIQNQQQQHQQQNEDGTKVIQRQQQIQQQAMAATNLQRQWNEIGGLGDVKEALLDLIYPLTMTPTVDVATKSTARPISGSSGSEYLPYNSNYYGNLLSHPPPGVLLYGPPGCGKTMLIKTLACSARARFLCITPSTLLRKYVGETNIKIRSLFSLARKLQPCILFVDEVDGLFRERSSSGSSSDEHEVSRDLKTEFMQLWDGMMNNEHNDHNRILVVGATNRPFDVDGAFLRRMPRSYFVGLPDYKARYGILSQLLKGVPLHGTDFNLEWIAKHATQGYSPSDMKELLRVSALFPLREARSKAAAAAAASAASSPSSSSIPMAHPPLRPLTTHDVLQAQRTVTPTPYSESYRQALTDFISSRRPAYSSSSRSSSNSGGGPSHYFNPSFVDRPNDFNEEESEQQQHGDHYHGHDDDEGNYDEAIVGDEDEDDPDFSSFDDDDDDDDTTTDEDGDSALSTRMGAMYCSNLD